MNVLIMKRELSEGCPGRGAHLRCSYDAIGVFREIAAEALGCAVAVTPDANGSFPEDHPSTQPSAGEQ
jgi:hypothetical protein